MFQHLQNGKKKTLALFQSENGEVVNTLIGDRFTTVRLQANADIRVNRLNLETEDYTKILRETFSISLAQKLDIKKIMSNFIFYGFRFIVVHLSQKEDTTPLLRGDSM